MLSAKDTKDDTKNTKDMKKNTKNEGVPKIQMMVHRIESMDMGIWTLDKKFQYNYECYE